MDSDQPETFIPPKDAAERLGVSASGLRRLATLYEGLYGALPRDSSDSRVWPLSAVERLVTARVLIAQGRAKSVQDALQATEPGSATVPLDALSTRQPSGEAFEAMVNELRALRAEIAEMRQEQAIMHRQLEAPKEGVEVNPQLQEILELNRALGLHLETPKDDSRERELAAQVADLEQRNRAMLGELERRRVEGEQEQTTAPWWRRWFGR